MKRLLVVLILIVALTLGTTIPVFALSNDSSNPEAGASSAVADTGSNSNGGGAKKWSGDSGHGGVCGIAY